ncbi:retrovirus-related pol polyprotein from transposon TNT 1-94 [Tanacetum coccineum]|uniref:Retrovirus-related pol polyprotein from transposon TNT 1-94 n=1 Tax=Tanacetum coccineum TaxID=301880 RepID=A0ABQ5BP50_9ASTR
MSFPRCEVCGSIAHEASDCPKKHPNSKRPRIANRITLRDVYSRGRSLDISYFHVFGCPFHIHNHMEHLEKFDKKADDGFFLGYSLVAKAFSVFNIRRQEMEGKRTCYIQWSREKNIELVNIIGEPLAGIITRSRITDSDAALASECLYVNFLSEMEPKKLIEALKEEGRFNAMQEGLNYLHGFMMYQMDVKSAFLNRKILEEVYVQQPPGFESSEFPNHVCKLDKALYGLKQAPRAWYETLLKFLIQHKFVRDYAGCNLDRKSTLGGCQILGGKLVCWSAKKQSSVAMSSAKAEYVVPIFCDNTSAIAISNNPVLHSKTKHIDIRYHFIRDHILKGDIELHFVPTDLQLTDIFTKPLAEPSFTRLVAELGMLNIEKQSFIPPFGEVNGDDTTDKSLSKASVQPVTQPKAPTDPKTKKKRIPPSSKPKSPYKGRVILPKKQVAETQYAKVTVATTDATKSLVAFELAEEQGNQLSATEAKKATGAQENAKSPYDTESKIKIIKSYQAATISGSLLIHQSSSYDQDKDVKEGDASKSLSGLRSMPDDDLASISSFELQDSTDHVFEEGTDTLHASANKPTQLDPLGHLHAELSTLNTKID